MNESVKLEFREGSSDKIYHAELTEHGGGYVVNFAYGRRGSSLATGTKTHIPVDYGQAKHIYDVLVRSKTSKGYKPDGTVVAPINTVTKRDTGLKPQLLNEITEDMAPTYINDERYCMQEKHDGRRKLIRFTGTTVVGANKLGFEIPVTDAMTKECQVITGACVIDGEDMGDTIILFDEISFPGMRYKERLAMLSQLIPFNSKTLLIAETAFTKEDKQAMWDKLKANKAEGAVFKLLDAPYSPGRPATGGSQYKCKFYESASCVVTEHSTTKRSIGVSVLDSTGIPVFVGNVTVYPNQEIPPVGSVVEIKYLYFYPNGSLYQPVLLAVRDDVTTNECLLSKLKTKREED